MPGVIQVKTARKLCSFYVTFSDHMKVLEAFGGSDELTLTEGRVNVLLDHRKESSS